MAKGGKQPGAGRPKGKPNKATIEAREAIAAFVEGNVDRLNGWLDQIAEESPLSAFDRFMSVVEYHIPKLAKQEHTGKDGGELSMTHRVDSPDEIIERYMKRKQQKEQIDV